MSGKTKHQLLVIVGNKLTQVVTFYQYYLEASCFELFNKQFINKYFKISSSIDNFNEQILEFNFYLKHKLNSESKILYTYQSGSKSVDSMASKAFSEAKFVNY